MISNDLVHKQVISIKKYKALLREGTISQIRAKRVRDPTHTDP